MSSKYKKIAKNIFHGYIKANCILYAIIMLDRIDEFKKKKKG